MLTFEQIEQIVSEHIELIPMTATGLAQAKDRAAKFLVVQAILSNHLKTLRDTKPQVSTMERASYAQCLFETTSKKITENKIHVEANPKYTVTREALELIDSEISWTKEHFEIFKDAHVLYRQNSKEQ
jgi:hypothetical protein